MSSNSQALVINLTTLQQHVDIVDEKGNKTSVNIMPRKRVHLEEGFKVCSNWIGRNPKTVKVHAPEVPVAAETSPQEEVPEPDAPTAIENSADSETQ